jgi:GT2 family glycosyltransferase
MNDTALIICNYNRKDDVSSLIESIIQQSHIFFDIIVVDNNSTDGSVSYLKNKFKDKICILENKTNLGGSGGFNKGMEFVLSKDYKYFGLLDSDVELDKNCLKKLREILLSKEAYGAVTAKIFIKEDRNKINEFGAKIHWETCSLENVGRFESNSEKYSKCYEPDYLSSCIILAKTEVLRKVGYFNQENFIYFDDVDWSVRVARAGWKLIAVPDAVGYHRFKKVSSGPVSTLRRYYFFRNLLNFFMNNASYKRTKFREDEITERAELLCKNIFRGIFGSYTKGMTNAQLAYIEALTDALSGKTGKAPEAYNRTCDSTGISQKKVEKIIERNLDKKFVIINKANESNCEKNLIDIFEKIKKKHHSLQYSCIESEKDILEKNNCNAADACNNSHPIKFYLCKSIYDLIAKESFTLKTDYIFCDDYLNLIANQSDFDMFNSYDSCYSLFRSCFVPKIIERIKELNKAND